MKSLVSEFSTSWRSFVSNITRCEDFLHSISQIQQKSVKVLNDYRAFTNITAQGLNEENPTIIVIGTLHVICGSSCLEYKPVMDAFLGGIKSIGSKFERVECGEEVENMSLALTSLLTVSCSPHPPPELDAPSTSESEKLINAKVYMKLASRTYDLFPVLKSVPVDIKIVDRCISCMSKLELWNVAVKMMEVYGAQLTIDRHYELLRHMSGKGELDWCADLLCVEQYPASAPGQAFGRNDARTPMVQDFIHRCMDLGDAKSLGAAGRVVEKYKLPHIAQEISSMTRNLKIEGFVRKGRWQLGEQLAYKQPQQIHLFQCLVKASMFDEADEVFQKFRLVGLVEQVSALQREQQQQSRLSTYLGLPVPADRVVVVSDLASLDTAFLALGLVQPYRRQTGEAVSELSCPLLVGVDVEWRAEILRKDQVASGGSGASLLQVATATDILLFDLPVLARPATRTRTLVLLQQLFGSADIVKLVWSFDKNDLRMLRLAASEAFKSAFRHLNGIFELCNVMEGAVKGKLPSLSEACHRSLGRPLDKSQQTSNWNARPLSPAQVQYAALDAHCLLGVLAANVVDTDCGLDEIRRLYSSQSDSDLVDTVDVVVSEAGSARHSVAVKRKGRSWRDLQKGSKRTAEDPSLRDESDGRSTAAATVLLSSTDL